MREGGCIGRFGGGSALGFAFGDLGIGWLNPCFRKAGSCNPKPCKPHEAFEIFGLGTGL